MIIHDQIITSRSNPLVKFASSLTEVKGRNENEMFIVEGEKLSFEALDFRLPVNRILVAQSKSEYILKKLTDNYSDKIYSNITVTVLSDDAFNKISTEKAPQGIISIIKHLDFFRKLNIIYKEEFFLGANEKALILCSVRDPGNLGAVIRSAVAFGTEHIILTKDCADVYNPKVIRSAMGSLFKVRITIVDDLISCIKGVQALKRRVFSAELTKDAISIFEAKLNKSDVVIIGNEGHGIPKEVSTVCDASVYIPISENTESLNASVAASIFIWELNK